MTGESLAMISLTRPDLKSKWEEMWIMQRGAASE